MRRKTNLFTLEYSKPNSICGLTANIVTVKKLSVDAEPAYSVGFELHVRAPQTDKLPLHHCGVNNISHHYINMMNAMVYYIISNYFNLSRSHCVFNCRHFD